MNQQHLGSLGTTQFRSNPTIFASGASPHIASNGLVNSAVSNPPPLPPRSTVNNYSNNYNYGGFGSGLGSYGSYGMGNWGYRGMGYGSYPSYGGYGNYGQYGPSGDAENRFVQLAEEHTRPAFQSIEAMVQTCSSITMMLESTFFAFTSSFRAILSVADNMGKLRSMFGQLLSTFTLIRFLKWLYYKLMHMFGFRSNIPQDEILWQKTISEVASGERTGPSSWPILVFIGMLVSIPYLLHRLMNNVKESSISATDPKEWFKCNEPIYTATASYNFVAVNKDDLTFKAGQKLYIAPQSLQPKNTSGWWRATDGANVGMIPSNYVVIVGQIKRKENSTDVDAPAFTAADSKQESNQASVDSNLENQFEDLKS